MAAAIVRQLHLQGCSHFVVADLRNAFDRVPISRLMDLVRKRVTCPKMLNLLNRVLTRHGDSGRKGRKPKGLLQGSPLSPLMMDLYLSATLDEPFKRTTPLPLVRYVDDLLVVCAGRQDAVLAYRCLTQLATSAGMAVKERQRAAIRELCEPGHSVDYIGFELRISGKGELAFRIGKHSWQMLESNLCALHDSPNGILQSTASLRGWLQHFGPCFKPDDRQPIYRRIETIMERQGLREYCPTRGELARWWRNAHQRWLELLDRAEARAASLSRRLRVD